MMMGMITIMMFMMVMHWHTSVCLYEPQHCDHDDHEYDVEVHRNKQKHASACQGAGQMPQLGDQACLTRVHAPLYWPEQILKYYSIIKTEMLQ